MVFEPVILGRTGLKVGRIGIGSGYGINQRMVEIAVEHGVNYLYWGSHHSKQMEKGIMSVAHARRNRIVLVLHTRVRIPFLMPSIIEYNIRKLGLDYIDILLLSWFNHIPSMRLIDKCLELKRRGLIRFLGISGHNRKVFKNFEAEKIADVFHVRYNAAHRGAEDEVFPYIPDDHGPGIVTFTTTRWGGLLKRKNMPPNTDTPRPRDCYRFVLSNPDVHVALSAPDSMEQLMENLKALDEGPMAEDELAWMRHIGDHVHKHSSFMDQIKNL
jgi:predicted aldo/keto reductase-like oxidoreductase